MLPLYAIDIAVCLLLIVWMFFFVRRSLRAADEKYRSIFENAIEGIIQTTPSGHFLTVNPAYAKMHGYASPQEMVRSIKDIGTEIYVYKEDREEFARQVAKYGHGRMQYQSRKKDGDIIWVMASTRAVKKNTDGEIVYYESIVEDISERMRAERELRESRERLNAALYASNTGTYRWEVGKDYFEADENFFELLGIDHSGPTVSSSTFLGMLHPWDRSNVESVWKETAKRGDDLNLEYRVFLPDKSIRWLLSRGRYQLDGLGRPLYLTGAVTDITSKKKVEEYLKKQTEELERSNRELEQFAYVSSHDLKEPLRMVTIYVELIKKKLGDQLSPEVAEYLQYAIQGSKRMQQLVNDLLSYSQMRNGATPLTEVDCNEVLKVVKENLKKSIDESGAKIVSDNLPIIQGHFSQICQLFQNLVGNAIKFKGENAPAVKIAVDKKGSQWLFTVNDNGIGISENYLKKIFVLFQRLHSSQKYPGTGIGLSVCKKIVENYGGKIWVESKQGEGSTFFFTLPDKLAVHP